MEENIECDRYMIPEKKKIFNQNRERNYMFSIILMNILDVLIDNFTFGVRNTFRTFRQKTSLATQPHKLSKPFYSYESAKTE